MYIELNYPYKLQWKQKINNIFLLITGIHKKKNLKNYVVRNCTGTFTLHSHE